MKIAVSGKGGTGKTFLAGSLAACFASDGHPVIAIDADPAPNLGLTLGLTSEEAAAIVPVAENEQLIRLKTGTEYSGVFRLTFTVDDIIARFAVPTPSGAHLLVMGTVRSPGSGCTCPAHSVVKALMRHLIVDRDDYVILDMDAGVEHLGRGTAERVDTMLVVSDANRKSLEVAGNICRMAKDAGIPAVGLVGNRIATSSHDRAVREYAAQNGIPVAGMIPFDQAVYDNAIDGSPVDPAASPAFREISRIAASLVSGAWQAGGPGG
ncbi:MULTISPECIES: AAA family ATPase [unclassified Methanoregula]|uniref:ATP-binding protein n=1 Tax=unclassified Methanoregula TaxID=2649730 RepID=UPI0009CC7656|nr:MULTISPECIES: AAA family ATPase [unclassified Methanoregula]OPX63052.1 MAG: protochlorophyllide reductase iron-sulfur ATP-binding protein [Methanoregula sp. PtaB.Bin085]OPY32327.1 MAG: protochlorophyllide reductase iron-sulfur ATP-binding protein [Methanoregula sp. PtaU1.Bin006]